MKEFLSIEKFKELGALFIIEIIIAILASFLIHITNWSFNYFDWNALCILLFIWLLSSKLDKEKYFNLATLIGTGTFSYACFWFMLNVYIPN